MATAAPLGESSNRFAYLGELGQHWRPLLAASLGTGTSLPLFAYTNSVFAPHLIETFGWSRGQFALISLTMLSTLLVLPFVGRYTDTLGVRKMALVGTLLIPLCFIGYALQNGNFLYYALVFTVTLAVGSFTGVLVYSRLIAQHFQRAQGLALTVMNCAAALIAIPAIPLLNWCIETYGWRAAYLGLGTFVFLVGLVAVWLAGEHQPDREPIANAQPAKAESVKQDYATILKTQVFWIIVIALYLCQLQTQLHSSQMNVMIIEQGMTKQTAANIASVYALGTIIGRLVCGVALDHLSTRLVTAISMGIPAIGFAMLGSSMDSVTVVTAAMLLVGVSVGAETDLVCFLVARYFKLRIYSTTFGLMHCFSFLASASGGVAVSYSLFHFDSFTPFLWGVTATIAIGACLFLLLPNERGFDKIG